MDLISCYRIHMMDDNLINELIRDINNKLTEKGLSCQASIVNNNSQNSYIQIICSIFQIIFCLINYFYGSLLLWKISLNV